MQTDHQGSLWEEKETQHRQLGARDKAGLSRALSQPPWPRYPKPIIPAWPAELQACLWTTTRRLFTLSADIFTKGSLGLRLKWKVESLPMRALGRGNTMETKWHYEIPLEAGC